MAYLTSDSINVFPCGNRKKYAKDRWLTEYNIVSVINRLVDKESFVVSTTLVDSETLVFNIKGYLFTATVESLRAVIKTLNTSNESSGTLTATIKIDADTTILQRVGNMITSTSPFTDEQTQEFEDLDSDNANSEFYGLDFSLSHPETTDTSIHLLDILEFKYDSDTKAVTELSIPEDSKIKFETNQNGHRAVRIDDGELM